MFIYLPLWLAASAALILPPAVRVVMVSTATLLVAARAVVVDVVVAAAVVVAALVLGVPNLVKELVGSVGKILSGINDLLVHLRRFLGHDHGAGVRVDLCLQVGRANKIDGPSLCLVYRHAQLFGDVHEGEVGVNTAVGLKHETACGFQEGRAETFEKEVGGEEFGALAEACLRGVKVEADK